MNKFLIFIEKHKFGVLAAIGVYIALFIYFQLETYEKMYVVPIWDERAELITEEIEIKPENIELNPTLSSPSDLKSISQNVNDKREKSMDNWSPNKISKSVEQNVKDLEKKMFEESGGAKKRDKILEEKSKQNDQKNQNKKPQEIASTPGSEKAYAGSVMVAWQLSNREPHQNNSWHVRNPGYTCGVGSSGKVTIKIKVNTSGNVTTATYIPEQSLQANSCMIEQAKKYALLSRFSYAASAPSLQEGFITYTFVSQ